MARAQMVCRSGRWRLYVIEHGRPEWPTHMFTGAVVPTLAERSGALGALGFALAGVAGWSWVEDAEQYGDPDSPVLLIAAADVVPAVGGAA
ncbi:MULTISPECIES: DUF6303 family protein [Streptomyces]|uniref:DUF6303 family protein n=1 Tax=Streptomyces TaxID=1883 RepID=UPI00167511B1|nr:MULTISPECIES: DUF6303 family protein [Streptomyces]MBD3577223.1 hypothetical protein [Streptomyces sp. KD18]GGS86457.1 hypothetical protein GCM10010286_08890 [Streptomyces toxytricini]